MNDTLVSHYEGLVCSTAQLIVDRGVELDLDDVAQLLRIKVWYALGKFSAQRAAEGAQLGTPRGGRSARERYVFMCMASVRKDIEKRPRRHLLSIDEIRGFGEHNANVDDSNDKTRSDRFDGKYLSIDHEQVFAEVEDEELRLPSTLSRLEHQLVTLRLQGRLLQEIDRELGLTRAQRERVLESVREKLADWRPTRSRRTAPMWPLPRAEPVPAPAPAALAA